MQRLNSNDENFNQRLKLLTAWEAVADADKQNQVQAIVNQVRSDGDSALLAFSQRFDQLPITEADDLEVTEQRIVQALNNISQEQRVALETAAGRIANYHRHQLASSWDFTDEYGNTLGQKVTPLERVGVYVPGGLASYPSSVLMNIIPAKVAGVDQVIMTSPTPNGQVNDMVLAAASIAGADKIFTVGGAQAIAALAYGTERVPAVDKIVGPGNSWVAAAKRLVFGQVGIDMIAGPSEILIISDGSVDPQWLVMDLFSQAEHGADSQSILISDSDAHLAEIEATIAKLLPQMQRKDIIERSLAERGLLIKVESIDQGLDVANQIAGEHVELALRDAALAVDKIQHAGAIFVGSYSAEVMGDYCAGPNHVLPTSGTARFSSPLGVYDFQKRSSVIHLSAGGAKKLAATAATLAYSEGLEAHAKAAECRLQLNKPIVGAP